MKGKMTCPICRGNGKIAEDSSEYEFQTRAPHSETCLTCGGSGYVAPQKKLPDGRPVYALKPEKKVEIDAQREKVPAAKVKAEAISALSAAIKDIAHRDITVRVTVLYISGTRAEVLDAVKEII